LAKTKAARLESTWTWQCQSILLSPQKSIRDHLKHNYDKEMLHNVLLVDKKEHWINKKMQMAYKINEANVFTIVCRNFKVTQAGWDRPISR
jgi:hypothetical protein